MKTSEMLHRQMLRACDRRVLLISWLIVGAVAFAACQAKPETISAAVTLPSGAWSDPTAVAPSARLGIDYYVSPRGRDSNDGSAAHPWATLQRAAVAAHPGVTVHVAPGEYRGPVRTTASGAPPARIRFISDTKWGAKLRASAPVAWLNKGDYVDIMGFDVTGDGAEGITNDGSYVRIIGNHVHDIPARGCTSNGGAGINNESFTARGNEIIGNVVHDIGPTPGTCDRVHGIYHSNPGGYIVDNVSYRNASEGIATWHAAQKVIIANNTVFANGGSGILVGAGDKPGGVVHDETLVCNNISVRNRAYGIQEAGHTGPRNLFVNNLVHGNGYSGFQHKNGTRDAGTISADPRFMRYTGDSGGDYRLQSDSPAVNAAAPQCAATKDLDGASRPRHSSDLGAYEHSARPASWPWL